MNLELTPIEAKALYYAAAQASLDIDNYKGMCEPEEKEQHIKAYWSAVVKLAHLCKPPVLSEEFS